MTCGICSTIAALYMNIQNYIDFIGGICAVNITIIFPCILYFRTNKYPKFHFKNIFIMLIMVVMGFIGFFSAAITIYLSFSK